MFVDILSYFCCVQELGLVGKELAGAETEPGASLRHLPLEPSY
jgi:hypothetical protein